jgi:pseudouridine-5'-phosphate glycosidase
MAQVSTAVAVAPEVAAALARGGAVVALESTIICHGELASTTLPSSLLQNPLRARASV